MTTEPKATYGLIGYPVKHSFSPAMHNVAFRYCNINAEYKLFEVKPQELEDFLLKRKDVVGFNITIPHKIETFLLVKDTITEICPEVSLTSAINTVKRQGDKLLCRNTDPEGFRKSLNQDLEFDAKNKNVLMLGSGGAGRAVMAGLNQEPRIKKLYIYDPNSQAAKSVSGLEYECNFISKQDIGKVISDCQLLVNASPVGMKQGDPLVIDKNLLHKGLFVYDVVYNRETELIKEASARCQAASGGLGMLLYQGVIAWQFWMRQKAPVKVMRQALEEELNKRC
jgi:shikimate dehydrogenase